MIILLVDLVVVHCYLVPHKNTADFLDIAFNLKFNLSQAGRGRFLAGHELHTPHPFSSECTMGMLLSPSSLGRLYIAVSVQSCDVVIPPCKSSEVTLLLRSDECCGKAWVLYF